MPPVMLDEQQAHEFETIIVALNAVFPAHEPANLLRAALTALVRHHFGAETADAFQHLQGLWSFQDVDDALRVIVHGPRPVKHDYPAEMGALNQAVNQQGDDHV